MKFFKKNLNLIIIVVILIFLIIAPLLSVFLKAVIIDGKLNLSFSLEVFSKNENLQMILNSLLLGILVVIVSTLIAGPLAFLFSRTELANKKIFEILFLIPFMTPPYIASMGWILFMQKNGLLQQIVPMFKGSENWFFTLAGLVLVMSLHIFPFMLTILKNAMANIPNSLLEAAKVFGANSKIRMIKIFLPLLYSNFAIGGLLVFVKTLSEYGTPSTLGKRIGFSVFTTDIHKYASIAPVDFGKSAALASLLMGICIFMWLMQNIITKKASYNLVGGKGLKVSLIKLEKGKKFLAYLYIFLVIFISIIIPYFSIISSSLIKLRGIGFKMGNFTTANYHELFFESQKGMEAIKNSFLLAFCSATIFVIFGTLIVTMIFYSKNKLGKTIEGIGLLPEMLPGIVIVIGIMIFWNRLYKILPLYNTMGIMVLAYVILFLPYTISYVTSGYTQISENLVAAGKVFGASPLYIFRKINLPLILKSVFSAWMMTFIIGLRELVTASLISPPNKLVISTFIVREFEQGSISLGMAMALITVLITTTSLILVRLFLERKKI